MKKFTIDEIKEKLQSALSVRRYAHTLRVKDEALILAGIYGANTEKTELAALLHDCAKDYPFEIMLRFCKEYGVQLDAYMEKSPEILHAFLGGKVAEREYGIKDEEILNAICYHTTGRMNMTLLEKIIYVADVTEPGRYHKDKLAPIRKMSVINLDAALYMALTNTKGYLEKMHKPIHPYTQEALADEALLKARQIYHSGC